MTEEESNSDNKVAKAVIFSTPKRTCRAKYILQASSRAMREGSLVGPEAAMN